jgi:3',5'-cyclic AMP phosphodiesterase CpdA
MMSIHLLSRRSLFRGAAGVGASVLLSRAGLAEAVEPKGAWWALAADTHIDPSAEVSERGGNMGERFKLVVRDILASKEPIAGVIVNGDLAHRDGQREAYTRLLGLAYPIRQAGIDVHWVLGNHDNREHFLDAAYGSRRPKLAVPGHYARAIQRGGVRWFLLDSLIRPNHAPGELGAKQLAWLKRELNADKRTPAVIVVHHNVQENPGSLVDGKALFETACANRQVKAVFQGHNHVYETTEIEGVHFVKQPGVGYAFGEDKPIGWVRAYVDPAGCELELRAVDGDKRLHGSKRKLRWR